MPNSTFARYKRTVRWTLIRRHGLTGPLATAFVNKHNEEIRAMKQQAYLPWTTASKLILQGDKE